MPQFYKTKKCPWFAVGRCRMDKECNWAHSIDELRPSVDLTRTKLCDIQLKEGVCKNPNCRYAHSRKELRATSDLFKTSLCVYWVKGSCAVGDSCRYAHGIEELRSKPQKGEFVPLEVETLSTPIPKVIEHKQDLLMDIDEKNNFYGGRLTHPYNAVSTTTSLSSINKLGSMTNEKSVESLPTFVANLFDIDNHQMSTHNTDASWQMETFHLSTPFTPLSLLDIPLVWSKSYGQKNNTSNNLGETSYNINFENKYNHYQNQVYVNNSDANIQSNKRYHNDENDKRNEVNQMSKRSYPESIEEFYSYTPSTAASVRDKVNLRNLEVSS